MNIYMDSFQLLPAVLVFYAAELSILKQHTFISVSVGQDSEHSLTGFPALE